MPLQSIEEVIIRLDEIIHWCIANNSRMGYFAALYKRMTAAVKKGIETGVFEDNKRMEKLDIIFANRYLDAYHAWQNQLPLSRCWKKTFEACNTNSLTVFQHLLLGISAHINLDLGIATARTAEGADINSLKNDFDLINKAIAALVNEVQDELSEINKPMKLVDRIFNDKDEAVANFSIAVARKEAWGVAVALAGLPSVHHAALITKTDSVIAQLAEKIIKPGFIISLILKLVKWFEWNSIGKTINVLNR
jgi:hypothetical protein